MFDPDELTSAIKIIKDLQAAPETIKEAQKAVLEAADKLEKAKAALKDREAELLLSGEIDGKNAEQRQAQMRQKTKELRENAERAEADLAQAKFQLDDAYNRFKALQAIARILAEEED